MNPEFTQMATDTDLPFTQLIFLSGLKAKPFAIFGVQFRSSVVTNIRKRLSPLASFNCPACLFVAKGKKILQK